ncbi:type VI secretion protein IcmF/TssM N-terminal domain-containing protein, partial [Glaciimonas sp. GG7]
MKRLFSWLFKSWLLSLLGVVMLSLLVWFEGPLFAFNGMVPFASSSVRWLFIWLFFAIWVGYFLWQAIAAKLASRRLLASLVPPKDSAGKDVQQQEVLQEQALLEKRLQQAMAVLRRAAPGKKKWSGRYLYQLPWYMFIGAPDSGKTTTLLHSGLKFPLTDALTSGVLDAPGGTRHCDWWFTDEAVLIDTAGRYITQDSPSGTDKIGWNGFLELLKKYRPRRPINGVIVVLSVIDSCLSVVLGIELLSRR